MEKFFGFALLSTIYIVTVHATSKPVSVRNKNMDQLVTSSLLTWESFNQNDAKQQLEYAIAGGEFSDKYPAYICRSLLNSVSISGYVMKRRDNNSHVCIVSQHSQIKTKGEFEILLNRGNGSKVEWVPWEKLSAFKHIDGAVSTINGGSRSEVYYVARHKSNNFMEHHEIDHAIGWFDPNEGLGKIHATVASSEKIFDNGEILVAFEAIRYELYDLKFKSLKLRENKKRIMLGETMLKNEDDKEMEVNAVVGYEYDIVRNLGNHDGIARSVNTTVFITKKDLFSFFWGIQTSDHVMKTKTVGTVMKTGTGLNVTLWGNYSVKEGPYDAYLVIYWADGSKSKKRRITVSSGYEANLEDQIEIEYSQTFWLHNNTVVPTTSQRTTSSSTSTTHRSIFSTSMSSNSIERITEKSSMRNDHMENEIEEEEEVTNSSQIRIASFIMTFFLMNMLLFIRY